MFPGGEFPDSTISPNFQPNAVRRRSAILLPFCVTSIPAAIGVEIFIQASEVYSPSCTAVHVLQGTRERIDVRLCCACQLPPPVQWRAWVWIELMPHIETHRVLTCAEDVVEPWRDHRHTRSDGLWNTVHRMVDGSKEVPHVVSTANVWILKSA